MPTAERKLGERDRAWALLDEAAPPELREAETLLSHLAQVFSPTDSVTAKRSNGTTAEQNQRPDVADTYRILVEQIPAVVFLAFFNRGFGEAYVSPQIEATLGFTQEEWLSDPVRWFHQIHPDDKERWSAEAAHTFLTGEPLRSVYRVMARDGHVVWFHCEVRLVRDAAGEPWFIHGIGFDISDLKRAEQALTRSEQMIGGIFEHAPDTMVVVDGMGCIERVNAQVERMFGYRREELLGKPVELLMPERFQRKHVDHRGHYLADPHLRPMGAALALYGQRKDGSEFPVEIMLSPLKEGTGNLVIAVIRDITTLQRNEAALRDNAQRMKELSRRLIDVQEAERRSIALELHDEIGQILTGLKLSLEMSTRLSEGEALASIAGAQALVNELMARTRKMSLDLRPATLDHLGLLPALLRVIGQYTEQTQVSVDFRHKGLEARRFASNLETAAFRIVQEGLTNIARHSGAEEARVRIWADQHSLSIQIDDRGKGFDAMATLAAPQSSGLSGMRDRALLLGGHFAVESKPGRGTRLTAEWNLDRELDPVQEENGYGAQV